MREILFHGKRKDNGEWVEGFCQPVYKQPDKCFIGWYERADQIIPTIRAVDPETVGQYTGKKDKKGKKIFEGHILRIQEKTLGHIEVGIVEYKDTKFVIDVYDKNWRYHKDIVESGELKDMQATIHLKYEYEVIGNIHDNPELLTGGEAYGNS